MKIKIEDLNKMDLTGFEGYYWYSDAEKPIQTGFQPLKAGEIPFVIEGFLFNEKSQLSISIKNFNGNYVINQFNLSQIQIDDGHRLSDKPKLYPAYSSKLALVKKLKFKELEKKMTNEDNFFYWKKVTNIFVGFEKS